MGWGGRTLDGTGRGHMKRGGELIQGTAEVALPASTFVMEGPDVFLGAPPLWSILLAVQRTDCIVVSL